MKKIDGCDMIVIAKLFTLIRNYRYGMDSDIREDFIKINEKIDDKVPNTIQEYNFFDGLHIQSPEDNVISLIKIMERLDIEIPNIPIDTQNIADSYKLVWEEIGNGMNITPELAFEITVFATKFLNRHEARIADENVDYCDNLYNNYRKTLKIVEDKDTIIDNKPPLYHIINDMINLYHEIGMPADYDEMCGDVYEEYYDEHGRWYCRVIQHQIGKILNL